MGNYGCEAVIDAVSSNASADTKTARGEAYSGPVCAGMQQGATWKAAQSDGGGGRGRARERVSGFRRFWG